MQVKAATSFQTASASRYLAMLCTHFGNRATAQCDANKGWVQFPFGRCDLKVDSRQLELLATAEDQKGLDLVVEILTSHLERFAFRENPLLEWHKPAN